MKKATIDFKAIVPKFNKLLERGLCSGVGSRDGQMSIEACVCAAMDLPHGDEPKCVSKAVRAFKIALNDSTWSGPQARATGLRDIGIAQIGSKGVIDDNEFSKRIAEKIIRVLIPSLFREVFKDNTECLRCADMCDRNGTDAAADAADGTDKYLIMAASLGLEVLRELGSPGVDWINYGRDGENESHI